MTAFRDLPGVQDVTRTDRDDVGVYRIETTGSEDLRAEISNLVLQRGWQLLRLQPIQMSLEEIFLRLTEPDSDRE